jgi:thioesterase domain-containing protein
LTSAELEAYLHEHIPLSAAMGVQVVECVGDRVALSAPLPPNRNHRDTAFGGSVVTLAILAGWARVHLGVARAGHSVHTVIQRSSVSYEAPIVSSFQAICEPIPESSWDRLIRSLDRRGRRRVHLDVRIEADGSVVARFRGAYVALTI